MVICFFGDSLTLGTGDQACLGWAGRICVPPVARGRALTYYNLGIRKDSSREIAGRWREEAARRVLPGYETRLVFAFGTGDAAILDGRRHVEPGETEANAEAILKEAAREHEVLFIGPPPVGSAEHTARNRELNNLLGTVCARSGVPYFDLFTRLADSQTYLADVAANDNVHPRAQGYAEMAEHITAWPAWQDWVRD